MDEQQGNSNSNSENVFDFLDKLLKEKGFPPEWIEEAKEKCRQMQIPTVEALRDDYTSDELIKHGFAVGLVKALNNEFNKKKRLHPDDDFFYPLHRQKKEKIRWLEDFPDVAAMESRSKTYYMFGIKDFLPKLQTWINQINNPIGNNQEKCLLFIDGAVKSGKTTFAKELMPFALNELRQKNFLQEDFCFAYLDLSGLAGRNSPEAKWKVIYSLFAEVFEKAWDEKAWEKKVPNEQDYDLKVKHALRNLNQYHVRRWIIVLDEYHFLFNRLDENQMETIAEQMKLILLDNDSPCFFVLSGSTQATFWWSIHKARPNGLNFMTGSVTSTTPFFSSDQDIGECMQVLIQKEGAKLDDLKAILDLLALRNVVNLCQVSRRLRDNLTPKEAYEAFVDSKIEVYWRDHAVPEGITPDVFMDWANGSALPPPKQLEHLLEKRGQLFYLRDPNFEMFLKTYYDPQNNRLDRFQARIPWADVTTATTWTNPKRSQY